MGGTSNKMVQRFMYTILFLLVSFNTDVSALQKVTLQLRWDNQFQFAGYYAAQWQGFYKKEGLEVTILPAVNAKGILSAVEEVGSGRAQFGVGAADIIIARDKHVPLVILASIFQHSAAGFYTPKHIKLESPADFLKLRVARRVNDLIDVELQALLRAEGIDPEKVKPYPHQPGMDHLLSGKVDVMPGYSIAVPFEAKDINVEFNIFRPIKFGVDFYGDSLFTDVRLIKKDPELVQRFTKASINGWAYAMNHREAVARQISETLPRTAKRDRLLDFNLFQSEGIAALMNFPEVDIGHINPARWERMHEYLKILGIVKNPIDINEFIFDPARMKIERGAKVRKILIASITIAVIIAVLLFAWVKTLRKTIENVTKGLKDSNSSLEKEIIERKKAEQGILEAAQRINAHIDNSPLAVIEFDAQFTVIRWSKEAEKIFGWTSKEIVGKSISEMQWVYPEDEKLVQKESEGLLNGKRQRSMNINRNYRKDGSVIHCEWYNSGIYDNKGKLISILSQVLDITKRKMAEDALKKSEKALSVKNRIAEIFLTIPDNELYGEVLKIVLESMESRFGTFAYINENGDRIVPSMTKDIWDECKMPDKATFFPRNEWGDTLWAKCLIEKKSFSSNGPFKFPKGHISISRALATPIVHKGESIGNFMVGDKATEYTTEDIHFLESIADNFAPILYTRLLNEKYENDRKMAENEKKLLENKLQQSRKMESIGTLAGGIAHDFNNILFPIMGNTEMLLTDTPEDSTTRASLKEIYTASLRARGLVKQILTFSRQKSSEITLMKVQPVVKEVLKLIRSTIPTTIEITQDINPDCGVIKADPTQIHQIVMNLATNAYHAMEKTGGELKVSLKERKFGTFDLINPNMAPGIYACLTVADTGVGMDKELTDKIFEPYFTTKPVGEGTGMGLSVVHGIVTAMGGGIQVYSEPGKGTQFHVYFPIQKDSFEEPNTPAKVPIQGGTEHILLVDDEKAILEMEKRMLERLGYQVTSLPGSLEALEAFRADPDQFDLIITDMQMPNMSGDKLSAELIKIRPGISILLCTGFSEIMSKEKASSLGIKDFILKPIVMKDLFQKIREVLDK